MTIRTLNFKTALLDGARIDLRFGRLMLATEDSGMRSWRATGEVGGTDTTLSRLANEADEVRVEFETVHDGTMTGQAIMSNVTLSSNQGSAKTSFSLLGTGPLAGWAE